MIRISFSPQLDLLPLVGRRRSRSACRRVERDVGAVAAERVIDAEQAEQLAGAAGAGAGSRRSRRAPSPPSRRRAAPSPGPRATPRRAACPGAGRGGTAPRFAHTSAESSPTDERQIAHQLDAGRAGLAARAAATADRAATAATAPAAARRRARAAAAAIAPGSRSRSAHRPVEPALALLGVQHGEQRVVVQPVDGSARMYADRCCARGDLRAPLVAQEALERERDARLLERAHGAPVDQRRRRRRPRCAADHAVGQRAAPARGDEVLARVERQVDADRARTPSCAAYGLGSTSDAALTGSSCSTEKPAAPRPGARASPGPGSRPCPQPVAERIENSGTATPARRRRRCACCLIDPRRRARRRARRLGVQRLPQHDHRPRAATSYSCRRTASPAALSGSAVSSSSSHGAALRLGGQRERDRLVVRVQQHQQGVADHPLAALVERRDGVAAQQERQRARSTGFCQSSGVISVAVRPEPRQVLRLRLPDVVAHEEAPPLQHRVRAGAARSAAG